MFDFISLFLISAGAMLVTIASILRMAWLAVIVPALIAGAAAVGLFLLSRRKARRARPSKSSPRMAA
jgi:hypothetical protein